MREVWTALQEAGAPDGAARAKRSGPLDAARLAAALGSLQLDALDTTDREVLHAWLAAFAQHWPRRFAELAGARGSELLAQLQALPIDADRYIKLRRIALENLAARI